MDNFYYIPLDKLKKFAIIYLITIKAIHCLIVKVIKKQ